MTGFDQTQSLQQQDGQHHGGNELYHDHIQLLAAELVAAQGYLINDGFGFDDPANEDTGGDGHNGHQNVVAQIVQDIQNLGVLAGGGVGAQFAEEDAGLGNTSAVCFFEH